MEGHLSIVKFLVEEFRMDIHVKDGNDNSVTNGVFWSCVNTSFDRQTQILYDSLGMFWPHCEGAIYFHVIN